MTSYGRTCAQTINPLQVPQRRARPIARSFGFLFLMLGIGALGYDTTTLLSSQGFAKFAGIQEFWTLFHKASLVAAQDQMGAWFGPQPWRSVVMPILGFPAALLFTLPGAYILHKTRPEIVAKAPTPLEMELGKLGLSSAQRRSLRNAA